MTRPLPRLDPGQIEVMDPEMVSVLRAMTPTQRLQAGFALWDSTRAMLVSHLTHTHPDWPAEQVQREVAHRMSHGTV